MATLEDFIAQYLKNKKIEDYETWLAKYGEDAEGAYRSSVKAADTAMAESKATYGTRASSLLSRGMTGSGYGDYLNGVAYAERQKQVEGALATKTKTEAQNKRAYAAYLDSEAEKAEQAAKTDSQKKTDLFLDLLSQNVEDETSAAAFLTAGGLDEQTASRLAKESVSIVKNSSSTKKAVLQTVLKKYLSYTDAYNYAVAYGLSPSVAEEIARAASAIWNASFDPNDYF